MPLEKRKPWEDETFLVLVPGLFALLAAALGYPIPGFLIGAGAVLGVWFFCLKKGYDRKHAIRGVGLAAGSLVVLFFIALPIVNIFVYTSKYGTPSGLREGGILTAIWLSAAASFVASVLSIAVGMPLAYLLARRDFFGKSIVESIVDVPVVVPHTVAGIALLTVFGRNGLLGRPLSEVGVRFVDAFPGIVVAMLFVGVPFAINYMREGFQMVDPRMEKVARTLGASSTEAFFTVTLPMSLRNVVVGGIMTWARGLSEFGAVVVLAYYPMTAPVYIYNLYTTGGLSPALSSSAVLLLFCLGVFVAARYLSRRIKVYDGG